MVVPPVRWKLTFTKNALKDAKKAGSSNLRPKIEALLEILKINPFQNPPPYEKLVGNLDGFYSRRINVQHRLVYEVFSERGEVSILSMWSHYE